jgi:hypothetical protein
LLKSSYCSARGDESRQVLSRSICQSNKNNTIEIEFVARSAD